MCNLKLISDYLNELIKLKLTVNLLIIGICFNFFFHQNVIKAVTLVILFITVHVHHRSSHFLPKTQSLAESLPTRIPKSDLFADLQQVLLRTVTNASFNKAQNVLEQIIIPGKRSRSILLYQSLFCCLCVDDFVEFV